MTLHGLTRSEIETRGMSNRQLQRISDSMAIARQIDEFDMYVDLDDVSVGQHLAIEGFWESWITSWICNTVTTGMTAVDIGANQGYFTFVLRSLVGDSGIVYAYEPNPLYVNMLRSTKQLNKFANVIVSPYAISDIDGPVILSIPGNLRGSASIVMTFDDTWGAESHLEARAKPLDALDLPVVDFIKIDAEGAEQNIWNGMQETVKRNPDIIVLMEWDARRFVGSGFGEQLYDTMSVGLVTTESIEVPISYETLQNLNSVEMITLRHKG